MMQLDDYVIAQKIFDIVFKIYIAMNTISLIYILVSFIKSKEFRKHILFARLGYGAIIGLIGYFFSKYCTTLINYDDACLIENIVKTFIFYILPLTLGITIINFIVMKYLGKVIKWKLNQDNVS